MDEFYDINSEKKKTAIVIIYIITWPGGNHVNIKQRNVNLLLGKPFLWVELLKDYCEGHDVDEIKKIGGIDI